jgi:hypothetical protein
LVALYAGTLELPPVLLWVSLVYCSLAHRLIRKGSRGFWKYFAYLSIQGFRTLNRVDDVFWRLYMMRRYVLCEQRRLLQWLSLFSFVLRFSLSLVASIAALGRSDTQKAYSC